MNLTNVRVLPRDPLDLLNLLRAARRRGRFRRMVREGYRPFATNDPGEELRQQAAARPARRVEARTVPPEPPSPTAADPVTGFTSRSAHFWRDPPQSPVRNGRVFQSPE